MSRRQYRQQKILYLARHYCKKKTKKIVVAGKKKLFDNCETGNVVDELVKIIPNIVTRLRKEGKLADFVTFLRLINEDKFPLNKISFLLLLEVSR